MLKIVQAALQIKVTFSLGKCSRGEGDTGQAHGMGASSQWLCQGAPSGYVPSIGSLNETEHSS